MLDLTTAYSVLYQVKLIDGTVLSLKRPTQALQESIMRLQKLGEKGQDVEAIMNETMAIFCRILNRNTDGIHFELEDLMEEYDYTLALLVLGDYLKFYSEEVAKQVNFQAAQ